MPLPHPPGYVAPRQTRLDRRRIALAAAVLAAAATLLLVLGRRAAAHAANALPQTPLQRALVVVLVAGGCGAWGEAMRQLATIESPADPEA